MFNIFANFEKKKQIHFRKLRNYGKIDINKYIDNNPYITEVCT